MGVPAYKVGSALQNGEAVVALSKIAMPKAVCVGLTEFAIAVRGDNEWSGARRGWSILEAGVGVASGTWQNLNKSEVAA